MAQLDELLVKIDASTELLRRELKRGEAGVNKFEGNVNKRATAVSRHFQKMGRAVKVTLAGLAAGFSVRAFTSFSRAAIAAGDDIGKAAKVAGISAETLQELQFAMGQLAGTTDKEVGEAIRRFNRRLGLATQGMGEAKTTFALMGIEFRDASGAIRSTEDVLEEAIDNLATIENSSIRAARASQIFGEDAGPRLAAALGEGKDAMDALRQATPGLLSDLQVQRAEELTDAFDKMARTVGGALKGAFIDATAGLGRFFNVAGAFATTGEIVSEIAEIQRQLQDLPKNPRTGGFFDPNLAADFEAKLDVLFDKLERRTAEAGAAIASAGSLDSIDARDFITQRSTVGRELAGGLGDIRADSLQAIDPGEMSAFQQQLKEMRQRVDDVRESVEYFDEETVARLQSMEDEWRDLGQAVSFTLRTALSNAFLGIEQDWRDTIRRMVADWIAQQALIGLGGAIGGPFGAFISGVTGRAQGGPVAAGAPYMVGERGPELFVPNASGRIVPGGGEGGGVKLYASTTIDARGADPALLTRLGPALDKRDQSLKAEIGMMIRRRKF